MTPVWPIRGGRGVKLTGYLDSPHMLSQYLLIHSEGIKVTRRYTAKLQSNYFIALIHPIQWTIANPVGADRPAKRQKKTSCVSTGWPVRSTVHSPDGASYFLPV